MLFYFKFFFGNFIAFLWWNVKEILQFSLVQHLEKFFHGNCNEKFLLESDRNYIPLSNGLVGKALGFQSRGPVFESTGWLQDRLGLSSFRGR